MRNELLSYLLYDKMMYINLKIVADQNKNTPQSPKKASVPNPFAQEDTSSDSSAAGAPPPNIPVPGGGLSEKTKKPPQQPKREDSQTSQKSSPAQKKAAAPQNIPTPQAEESVQEKSPTEPASKNTGFADEVLKPKEKPRKNPMLAEKEQQNTSPAQAQPQTVQQAEQSSPAQAVPQPPSAPVSQPATQEGEPQGSAQAPVIDEVPPLQEVPAGVSGEDLLKSLSDSQVSGAERKALVYKIVTGLIVVGFLAAITFGAVFAYNRWVQPSLNSGSADSNENVNQNQIDTNTNTDIPVQDPATLDTDGDTLPDQWELQNGLNANDPADAQDDPDFDQLKNVDEYSYGTNPQNPDTDADGFRDGAEVQQGYNPNGAGRLNDTNTNTSSGLDFKDVQGNWSGTFNGANLFADDLEFKLDDEGEILGTYNFSRQDGTRIFGQAKGDFTFNASTGQFFADMNVKGFYEQESVDYTMKLTGQAQGEGRLSGTWNITPAREVPWLSVDNGTFVLNK